MKAKYSLFFLLGLLLISCSPTPDQPKKLPDDLKLLGFNKSEQKLFKSAFKTQTVNLGQTIWIPQKFRYLIAVDTKLSISKNGKSLKHFYNRGDYEKLINHDIAPSEHYALYLKGIGFYCLMLNRTKYTPEKRKQFKISAKSILEGLTQNLS